MEQEMLMPARRDPAGATATSKDGPRSLAALNRMIAAAKPMVPGGTRAVLGEGPLYPAIAFVGEQPGDQEDLQGRPFVGPAGKLLDRALEDAGIDRSRTYITNAVKHFKFEPRGKKRLHGKPNAGEVKRYRGWLEKELELVDPGLVVALGGTAILALAGKALPVLRNRGPHAFGERPGYITVHPSSLLRAPDEAARKAAYAAFVADLRAVRKLAGQKGAA
jgi:DNA polymerase